VIDSTSSISTAPNLVDPEFMGSGSACFNLRGLLVQKTHPDTHREAVVSCVVVQGQCIGAAGNLCAAIVLCANGQSSDAFGRFLSVHPCGWPEYSKRSLIQINAGLRGTTHAERITAQRAASVTANVVVGGQPPQWAFGQRRHRYGCVVMEKRRSVIILD
jgi:hypothetical protein